jgi:hypothetical protein
MIHKGVITSLGDYTELTTQIVHIDGYGQARSGMYDTQKERFINGITIGGKTFGRVSCAANLYPFLEVGKEAEIYTWMHPFLGLPPIRTGIIGIVYPDEKRAYVSGLFQMSMSLLLLACLPLLWLIPGIIIGSVVGWIGGGLLGSPGLSLLLTFFVAALVTISPWLAGLWMLWTQVRLRRAHPYATTPPLRT